MVKFSQLLSLVFFCVIISETYSDEKFDNFYNAGKHKEAIEYANQKIPPASRDATIWVKIAKANEKAGLIEKALACYMVSWRMNPKDYASLLGAARIYNKLKQYDRAVDMAKKALDQQFTGEASWEYARACIALKKPAEAKKALEKVIETDPGNIVANRELGIIYYDDKQYKKAIPLLKKSYEKKASAAVAYQIGKCYLETGKSGSAIEYLKKAIEKKKSLYTAGLGLARAYYHEGKYSGAADEYTRIEGKITFKAKDYFYQAKALERVDRKSEAIAAYRSAIGKYGSSKKKEAIVSRHKVGVADLKKKRYSAALTQFKFIANADPKAMMVRDIHFLLADAYLGTKNSIQAIKSLEKAIAQDPSNVEAYARLADLYTKNGMPDKAKKTYEKMMSLSPNDPNVYLVLGEYNLKAKKYSKALNLFVKSNGLEKSAAALEGIALSASALKQWDKARDAAESAVSMEGSRIKSRKVLANALVKEKSYKEAKVHLEVLVSKEPTKKRYWEDLAECYERLKDKENLAKADKKIIALDRNNTTSRMRYAKYCLKKGDKETAYKYFGELALLKPRDPAVFKNLYKIALDKNQKSSAITYLKKYVALNANDAESQKIMGDLLYEKKNLDGALVAYRKAIKIDPGIKGFYKRYAEIVIVKGQQNEVIKALNGVIKQGEADFGTYTTLGTIYMKKRKYSKSKDMYQQALMIDPQNTDALAALGECQVKLGDISGAVITYEQAVMMDSKAGIEYKTLGDLYMKQKKTEQAMKAYGKYLDRIPKGQAIAKKVGNYLYKKKDYKGAAKYLTIVKGRQARLFMHQLKLAESYFYSQDYQKAIPLFIGLLKRKPKIGTRKNILLMKAEAYEKEGDTAKAVLTYDEYSKIKGVHDGDVDYKRAFLREKSNPTLAQKIYAKNISLYPNDSRNFLRLGLIYSKNKATLSKAAPMLEKAAARAKKDKSLWLEIAQIYGKLKKESKELAAYKKYIKADPQNLEANIRIGSILIDKGKTAEGIIYLETANTLSPNNIKIMGPLASGYLKTNRTKNALAILQKAKQTKPDNIDIRKCLFMAYKKIGDKKAALTEIKELLDKKHDSSLLLLYAGMLLEEGKTRNSENVLEDIMAVDPENIDALMLLAKVKRAKKKYDRAIEIYKDVLHIDPNYAPALYERAETYMLQKKYLWAEKFYNKALRTDPEYGLAELGKAKIAKFKKDKKGYKTHLKKAKQLDPKNPVIQKECRKAGL